MSAKPRVIEKQPEMMPTFYCSLHSLHKIVIMDGKRGCKVIGCAQRQNSQASFLGCILCHQLIHNLVDGAIASSRYENVIVCTRTILVRCGYMSGQIVVNPPACQVLCTYSAGHSLRHVSAATICIEHHAAAVRRCYSKVYAVQPHHQNVKSTFQHPLTCRLGRWS